jgi:hypothetical protein
MNSQASNEFASQWDSTKQCAQNQILKKKWQLVTMCTKANIEKKWQLV